MNPKAQPGTRTILIRKHYPTGKDPHIAQVVQCEDGKSFFAAVTRCMEQCLSKHYKDTFQPPRQLCRQTLMRFEENIGIETNFSVTADLCIDHESEQITLNYRFPVPQLASRQSEVEKTLLRLNRTLRFPKFLIPKETSDCILAIYPLPVIDCFSSQTFLNTLETFRWSLLLEVHTFRELAGEKMEEAHDETPL